MASHASVIDIPGNFNENIQFYAKKLAARQRRAIFEEVYKGHKRSKYVSDIAAATGLSPIRVAQEASKLASIGLVEAGRGRNPRTGKSETFYQKRSEIAVHKAELLAAARDKKKRDAIPTKWSPRSPQPSSLVVKISLPRALVKTRHITLDDIDSFAEVRKHKSTKSKLEGLSEEAFKNGLRSIIGESAEFKDWGGERSDLMTTRVLLEGKRVRAAFAFKGPGQPGKLTIAKMGKNGDQGPRLFEEAADLYVVQHWREIDTQVHKLIETLATAKSVTTSGVVFFCILDGQDSSRLVDAYPSHFFPVM
jgi:hypothetical protein